MNLNEEKKSYASRGMKNVNRTANLAIRALVKLGPELEKTSIFM